MNEPTQIPPRTDLGVLRRRLDHRTERAVAFAHIPETLPLSDLLVVVRGEQRADTLYLVGETPPLDWWREPLAHGWAMTQWHNALDRRTAVYESAGGAKLDVRMASSWFDTTPQTSDTDVTAAWQALRRELRMRFGPVIMLTTPAMTGLELLEASMPFSSEIAPLDDETQTYIRDMSIQGRLELFPRAGHLITGAWQLDARWMYAACCHGLPVGPVLEDEVNEYAGFVPGFYWVKATIPQDWAHIGLLPDMEERTTYPREPGVTFESWCTGAELGLALDHGWTATIRGRLLWPETIAKGGPADPVRPWITHLRAARELLREQGETLAAGAIRHISLDTIGRWFSHDTERHGMLPLASIGDLPPDAIPHVEQGIVLWSRHVPIAPALARYSHPEWAATVWGRARARLAKQALALPFEDILALRTDAIWLDYCPTGIADNGKPGAWRVKSRLDQPGAWPQSEPEMLAIMRAARAGEER